MCYQLSGKTADSTKLLYFGYVRVLPGQSLPEAVEWRKGKHLEKLKYCLRDLDPETAVAKHIGTRQTESYCLRMETVLAICNHLSLGQDIRVRGGPFVLYSMTRDQLSEIQQLSVCQEPSSWRERLLVFDKQAQKLPASSHTRRHLTSSCFRCGGKNWRTCNCKAGVQASFQVHPSSGSSTASSSSMSTKIVLPISAGRKVMKGMKAMTAMRPMKVMKATRIMKAMKKRDRSYRDRSGEKSKCGNDKRKKRHIGPKHKKYRRLKWGPKFRENWKKATDKYRATH